MINVQHEIGNRKANGTTEQTAYSTQQSGNTDTGSREGREADGPMKPLCASAAREIVSNAAVTGVPASFCPTAGATFHNTCCAGTGETFPSSLPQGNPTPFVVTGNTQTNV